jgi:hypothetical protein
MIVTFWLNAFIPRDVPGYTRSITRGRHAGKTAVPLPGIARLNPLNWKDWDAGYLTDQRGFSGNAMDSCRMQSLIEFDLSGTVPTIRRQLHRTSGTTEVDMDTGAQLGFDKADMSGCRFFPLTAHSPTPGVARGSQQYRIPFGGTTTVNYPTNSPPAATTYKTRLVAAAGDPLVSAAADINYVGVIELVPDPDRPGRCSLSFEGHIDEFPAYDCYAKTGSTTKTVFTNAPPTGHTVTDLLGAANRSVRGAVSF